MLIEERKEFDAMKRQEKVNPFDGAKAGITEAANNHKYCVST